MMILVVISFMLCMTPIKVRQIIEWFYPQLFISFNCTNHNLNVWIIVSFRWLAALHSVVNPIIYSFMSKNFRVIIIFFIKKNILFKNFFRTNFDFLTLKEDFLTAMKKIKNYLKDLFWRDISPKKKFEIN